MVKHFCDMCNKEASKDELHQVYPDIISRNYVELCENCFQEYLKEMQSYIDRINYLEEERKDAIKKYFINKGLSHE